MWQLECGAHAMPLTQARWLLSRATGVHGTRTSRMITFHPNARRSRLINRINQKVCEQQMALVWRTYYCYQHWAELSLMETIPTANTIFLYIDAEYSQQFCRNLASGIKSKLVWQHRSDLYLLLHICYSMLISAFSWLYVTLCKWSLHIFTSINVYVQNHRPD